MAQITVGAGSQPHQVLVLADQGFMCSSSASSSSSGDAEDQPGQVRRGNMYVRLLVSIPKSMSSRQRDLLLQYREIERSVQQNERISTITTQRWNGSAAAGPSGAMATERAGEGNGE